MQFTLRPWSLSDIDSLVEYGNNFNIAKNMRNVFPHPYTKEVGIKFMEKMNQFDPSQVFTIDIEGEASGGIGIFPEDDIMCKILN